MIEDALGLLEDRLRVTREHVNAVDATTREREEALENRLDRRMEAWVRGVLTDEEWETAQRLIADGMDITTAVRSARILEAGA